MEKQRCSQAGVTLIELMIVLSILGILVSIALPAYQDSMRKARRSDGFGPLMELAARQERYYAQNTTYTTAIGAATGLNYGSDSSPEGYYTLSASACASGTIATCYVLTASPKGAQLKDDQCGTLTLNSRGQKQASGPLGAECW